MNNYDWIQWLYVILLITAIIAGLFRHGDAKTGYHDFRVDFMALVISLPFIGRILGWW